MPRAVPLVALVRSLVIFFVASADAAYVVVTDYNNEQNCNASTAQFTTTYVMQDRTLCAQFFFLMTQDGSQNGESIARFKGASALCNANNNGVVFTALSGLDCDCATGSSCTTTAINLPQDACVASISGNSMRYTCVDATLDTADDGSTFSTGYVVADSGPNHGMPAQTSCAACSIANSRTAFSFQSPPAGMMWNPQCIISAGNPVVGKTTLSASSQGNESPGSNNLCCAPGAASSASACYTTISPPALPSPPSPPPPSPPVTSTTTTYGIASVVIDPSLIPDVPMENMLQAMDTAALHQVVASYTDASVYVIRVVEVYYIVTNIVEGSSPSSVYQGLQGAVCANVTRSHCRATHLRSVPSPIPLTSSASSTGLVRGVRVERRYTNTTGNLTGPPTQIELSTSGVRSALETLWGLGDGTLVLTIDAYGAGPEVIVQVPSGNVVDQSSLNAAVLATVEPTNVASTIGVPASALTVAAAQLVNSVRRLFTPPSMPPPLMPPPHLPPFPPLVALTHTVRTELVASGSLIDFVSAGYRTALIAKLAAQLSVPTWRVNVAVLAGSVRIIISIAYENQADAQAGQTTLATQTATLTLASAFLSTADTAVTVDSITIAPSVAQFPSSPPPSMPPTSMPPSVSPMLPPSPIRRTYYSSSDSGCDGGCVGGIIGGCFVPVLMLILWLSGVFAKYGCPSPCAKAAEPKDAAVTMSTISATPPA